MSKKAAWKDMDARSRDSLTRFHTRTGWEPTSNDMPYDRVLDVPLVNGHLAELQGLGHEGFLEALARREDGEEELGEYEITQRIKGAARLMHFLLSRGATPMDFFRQFTAVGRAMHIKPYCEMTMQEVAMMEGQTKAAHSFRCKVMSGEIELKGMRAKLPGQKSKAASASYREARKGNCNRVGGAKTEKRRARQQSFLRKLHVKPTPKMSGQSDHQTIGQSEGGAAR